MDQSIEGFPVIANITLKIRSMYDSLPDAEKRVASYVLDNTEEATIKSIYDLSQNAKVSVASVSRLARKIGCSNFKEFKIELAKEVASPVSAIYEEITSGDSDEDVVRKVFGGTVQSIQETLRIVDFNVLSDAARRIGKAKYLVFVGIGGSGHVAKGSALRFSHLGLHAEAYTDPLFLLVRSMKFDGETVVIGISHSGRSSLTVKALEFAHEQGAYTLGIGNYRFSPLDETSDAFICTVFRETSVRAVALSSRISQMCVLDALYALVAKHKKVILDPDQINRLIETNLRSLP